MELTGQTPTDQQVEFYWAMLYGITPTIFARHGIPRIETGITPQQVEAIVRLVCKIVIPVCQSVISNTSSQISDGPATDSSPEPSA